MYVLTIKSSIPLYFEIGLVYMNLASYIIKDIDAAIT